MLSLGASVCAFHLVVMHHASERMASPVVTPTPRAAIDLGLERMRRMLEGLGNPQRAYGVVHVAGTNGKGSVCTFIEAALRAAGYHTGRFVSPYLVEPRDAVTVNGGVVREGDWAEALASVERAAAATAPAAALDAAAATPTVFEVWTAAAFLVFARARVDVAVVEVGVGGRTDATNIIEAPLCSIITSISVDHVPLLGRTLSDIARHKAGIIKAGCHAIISPFLPSDVEAICREEAATVNATIAAAEPLEWVSKSARIAVKRRNPGGKRIRVNLLGDFQLENAALALCALEYLSGLPQTSRLGLGDAIARGFDTAVSWPGRMQRVRISMSQQQQQPSEAREFVLDGGHNEAAVERVRAALDDLVAEGGHKHTLFIYGGTSSRDVTAILSRLLRAGDGLIAVPFSTPVGMPWIAPHPPSRVAAVARDILRSLGTPSPFVRERASVVDAVRFMCFGDSDSDDDGLRVNFSNALFVICGSLYLMSDVYRSKELCVEAITSKDRSGDTSSRAVFASNVVHAAAWNESSNDALTHAEVAANGVRKEANSSNDCLAASSSHALLATLRETAKETQLLHQLAVDLETMIARFPLSDASAAAGAAASVTLRPRQGDKVATIPADSDLLELITEERDDYRHGFAFLSERHAELQRENEVLRSTIRHAEDVEHELQSTRAELELERAAAVKYRDEVLSVLIETSSAIDADNAMRDKLGVAAPAADTVTG